ncbi:MAG: hypothetical protein H6624_00955 [Bdellovibrionaceae bacterium]|nr:hypothetical protein [Bdellovibrionales bacterium]MCB9082877.1 hypothetical protein [Pseudobdellovibrionaceae bacterium]
MKQKLAKTLGLGGILVGVAMVSSLAYGGVNEDLKRMQSQLTVSPKLSLNEKLRRLRSHCQKPVDSEPVVVRSDFPWNISPAELLDQSIEMYESGKRMFERAYYDSDSGQLRMRYIDEFAGIDVNFQVPMQLPDNYAGHIEEAMDHQYGEVVAFPDMGHVHMQTESASFGQMIGDLEDTQPEYYTRVLDSDKTGMLYHTAEQMNLNAPKVIAEKTKVRQVDLELRRYRDYVKHRFMNRNLFGLNDGSRALEVLNGGAKEGDNSNLINVVPGYSTNLRLYFHANKNGCFSYVRDGKVEYFDISAEFPTGEIVANQNIVGE